MSTDPPKFSFGATPSTSSSSTSGLSASSKLPASNLFGEASMSQSTGGNAFGVKDADKPAAGGWSFPAFGTSKAGEIQNRMD